MYSFVLLTYLSILLPISHYTDYSSFIVSLKIRHCESSKFFPLQKYFGYSKYLYLFVYTCEIAYTCPQNILRDSKQDCTESTNLFERTDSLTISTLPIPEYNSSPFIQIFIFTSVSQFSADRFHKYQNYNYFNVFLFGGLIL